VTGVHVLKVPSFINWAPAPLSDVSDVSDDVSEEDVSEVSDVQLEQHILSSRHTDGILLLHKLYDITFFESMLLTTRLQLLSFKHKSTAVENDVCLLPIIVHGKL
jgi:hypothetical protein